MRAPKVPVLTLLACLAAAGQTYRVIPAPSVRMPVATVDGNSPGFWENGTLHVYTSTGAEPARMRGSSVTALTEDEEGPRVEPRDHYPIWIEAVWRDEDGTVYGWYHHEPNSQGICGSRKLTAPKIGALVSHDGGKTFTDLGIVLASGDPPNCSAQNGFFAGGHGDFSVVLDREKRFFYFLFTNYAGSANQQGVAIARMAFEDRARPVGAVRKYYLGQWDQPGVGGLLTAIFPAYVAWDRSNADSHWGAAVHWNTKLESYVAVMNRACCQTNWPQEGIYIAFNRDLADPGAFTRPEKILDDSQIGFAPGYYPQVFGLGEGETDSLAGAETRLFVKGVSKWRIVFGEEPEPEEPADPSEPEEPSPDCMNAECSEDPV